MRIIQPHRMKFAAVLLGLALATMAWADITNTATALFSDVAGANYSIPSNTVVVVVSTSSLLPATPTLDLLPYIPITGTIRAGYSGSDPAAYFNWTFTAVSQIPVGAAANGAGVVSRAPNGTLRTQSPQASLSAAQLGLGPYLVTVTVVDNSNNVSAPAQAYTTLVSADLSGVHVYPNPWRSDKHATRPVTFDNLTVNTTIKIFTVSWHLEKSLPIANAISTWDLTDDSGNKVASGLYLYLIKTDSGQKKTGKLAIVK